MKKNLKVMLISGIASVLTATVIFVSGGSTLIVALLGGAGAFTIPGVIHLNSMENKSKSNHPYAEQTDYIPNALEILNLSEEPVSVINLSETDTQNRVVIAPIKQYDDAKEQSIITELITTDALSQQENILVKRRKKETEEKVTPKDNYKK